MTAADPSFTVQPLEGHTAGEDGKTNKTKKPPKAGTALTLVYRTVEEERADKG